MNIPEDWTADTVRANGVELQYYRTGDGPPLVMAHGFYDNGRCWEPLAEDLSNDYELVMYDARGHGRSDAPESGYAIEDRVADLVGVVEGLSLENPLLLGHSMGGSTVAWTAATHPDFPRAIVLEDPVGMLEIPDRTPDEWETVVHDNLERWGNKSVAELTDEYADERPKLARRIAVARNECSPQIAKIPREGYPRSTAAFEKIGCPTLVLRGDVDPEKRVADLDTADELADGRLVHVAGAGHCVFRDRYDAAYRELRTFLQRI
ncbi:Pimeloyl-ACP methyl ester carboxylesterase [Haladaptatus litoreus]|uniref:Pimeloyl-ACP methyl ester carboxylesterase n=1 Tax=Haladaptatus litoreus TaxID=553468 RepID=A0A1N7E1V4_9EURY|nr:alpha/beta hydrolase [Haladaptatus litoreus]SIR82069.1 Pimeloyl-ACP methyl ester carboxylesterase [Haladaptatus litoreus]